MPVSEPGLNKAIGRNRETISFVSDPKQLGKCDVVYISMDVKTDGDGKTLTLTARDECKYDEADDSDNTLTVTLKAKDRRGAHPAGGNCTGL